VEANAPEVGGLQDQPASPDFASSSWRAMPVETYTLPPAAAGPSSPAPDECCHASFPAAVIAYSFPLVSVK
jgi:hypothetical protein